MIKRQKTPCVNCVDRVIGCHSNCIKYIDWKQRQDIIKEKAFKDKELNRILYGNRKVKK